MTQHNSEFIAPQAIPAKAISRLPERAFTSHSADEPAGFLALQNGPDFVFVQSALRIFVSAVLDQDIAPVLPKMPQDSPTALDDVLRAEAARSSRPGPYGRFPPAPLTFEDLDGPAYRVSADLADIFGAPLSAALEYAHLILTHPGDSGPQAEAALLRAGWPAAALPDLTSLIETVALQVRLHALGGATVLSVGAFA